MQNILLSSIFRKLPLKFLLVILAVFAVCMACFSNAGLSEPVLLQTYTTKQADKSYTNNNYELLCIQNGTCGDSSLYFNRTHGASAYISLSAGGSEGKACGISHTIYFSTNNNCTFYIYGINSTNYTKAQCKSTYGLIEDSECVGMDSLQCQLQYNLIPISSVDQNYCTSNNLCPAQYTESQCKSVYGLIDESECTGGSGGSGSGLSLTDLYINNILHVGAPTIFMNIPEEIDWDYAYTNGGNIMNIDVVGYNQDTEYINGLIDINNYKPTSEDFTNVFSNFSNFGGLLIAALFVILVFYFVKKMFK